ncbi:MAG: flagellar biosynthetic protein FliO [Desulfobacteraceae bacterium]|nr:flagellar biosynthetic protein FliO [Desulfobacteraceae bacterium]
MNSGPEMTIAVLKMLLSLAGALAVLFLLYRWSRKNLSIGHGAIRSRMIRVIESQYLGPKKVITLVQIPDSVLVIGVSADTISLLSRIDDPDVIASIQKSGPSKSVLSFREQLKRMTRPNRPSKEAVKPE